MKSILLLGDAHLRHGDSEAAVFLQFLRSVPPDTEGLFLLGDLFDLWIGAPAFLTPTHHLVGEALASLRRSGVRIAYVEGNRDYHLRSLAPAPLFDLLVPEETDLMFGGRRIRLAHGDLVNRQDRPYRTWRRLAKGPALIGILRHLPRRLADRTARALERRIAGTNRKHRIAFPEEECRRFALERRRNGSDTLVLGHFHREMRFSVEGPEGGIEVFILPSWREGRRYLRIQSDGSAAFTSYSPEREAAG